MKKYSVIVMPRQDIQDPQGTAVREALRSLGYDGVSDCRIGKVVVLTVEDYVDEASVGEMARRLLSNPVTETFRVEEGGE